MSATDDTTPVVRAWLGRQARPLSPEVRAAAIDRVALTPQHPGPETVATRPGGRPRAASRLTFAAVAGLTLVAAAAATLATGQQPTAPAVFASGTIAFSRDDALYVMAPGGGAPVEVPTDPTLPAAIRRFAFSPDRTHLAAERYQGDSDSNARIDILDPDLDVSASILGDSLATDLPFGWSPDGQRLAIHHLESDRAIGIVDRDGRPTGSLTIPVGADVTRGFWQEFASLAWSPDGHWIALPVHHDLAGCSVTAKEETCYLLLATDGSGTRGVSAESSGYLAWAPDDRVAVTHWPLAAVDVLPADLGEPTVIHLAEGMKPSDGHVLDWSPDGSTLAAVVWTPATRVAGLMSIDVSGVASEIPMTVPFETIFGLAWSPDGGRLLFSGTTSGTAQMGIWSVASTGGTPELVAMADSLFSVAGVAP